MPDCNYGYDLEVHHIQPLSKGGTDTFDNLIILCKACHRSRGSRGYHKFWEDKILELTTIKFYNELGILGFASDIPNDEFLKKVSEYKASNKVIKDTEQKIDSSPIKIPKNNNTEQ